MGGAFGPVDWHGVFVPKTPLLEILARGTIVYLTVFLLLRFVLKRQSGSVGITDLLVVVLISDASQNAMASDYKSVPDGVLLVSTIIFWSYALDWIAFHFPAVRWIIHPPPLDLVRDGKVILKNMRVELISIDELMSQLREQGVEHLKDVKCARMEGDGHLSVVKRDGEPHPKPKKTSS